jgi:two-component system, cell cycle sensor histidine kinase and response regulator CckA
LPSGEQELTLGLVAENSSQAGAPGVAYPASYYSSLLRGLIHKLNNQLTVLTGNTGLLLMESKLPKEVRKALEQMTGTLEQISVYLDEASAAGKHTPVQLEALNLHDLVEDLDRPAGLQLVWDKSDRTTVVQADRTKLKSILEELLRNAESARAKRVTISIRREGSNVELILKDDGSGLRPEVLNRAFEPFYTTRPKEQARGLGLFRARGELNRMNGDLALESDGSSYSMARLRFSSSK